MKQTFGRNRVLVSVAAAAAFFVGGAITYSISAASASPVTSQQVVAASPQGIIADCLDLPDMDWASRATPLLPDLVSFRTGGAIQGRESDPCDGDGDGGGGGPSCLSQFEFDPEDYWVVFDFVENNDTQANLYAAATGTFSPLAESDIPTATACTVTYEWVLGNDPTFPLSFLFIDYPPGLVGGSATGATTTELTVTGSNVNGPYELYGLFVCGDVIGLEVSDGINSYIITGPPCSDYRYEAVLYTQGHSLTYDFQDPWGRAQSVTTLFPVDPSYNGNLYSETVVPIVKPQSPLTITFGSSGVYTVTTGDSTLVNCADPSAQNPTSISNSLLSANATWSDPSPVDSRIYCVEEVQT